MPKKLDYSDAWAMPRLAKSHREDVVRCRIFMFVLVGIGVFWCPNPTSKHETLRILVFFRSILSLTG